MLRTLIVEDSPDAKDQLVDGLHRYEVLRGVEFQIVWVDNAEDMLADKSTYDLVLLDIDLPEISGMEAAQLLRVYDPDTPIIFVTNLAKFAVKGYEVGVSGFIVKPVTMGILTMNLDRALRTLELGITRNFMVDAEDGAQVVPLSSLVWVEVFGHRLSYYLADGRILEERGSLGELESRLPGAPLLRVSKSMMVNMDKVTLIRGQELGLSNGDKLKVSRNRKQEVTDALTDYMGGSR